MIKILFFIPGLSEGGAEKVLCNLVNNMDQSKFDITVQTLDLYDPGQYLAPGIHYKAINRRKTGWGRKLFSYWFRFCAEFKLAYRFFVKGKYDIEVAYLETIATKIIAQSVNKKAVKLAWVHCDLSQKAGVMDNVEKMKKQYQKFDRVVCVSQGVLTGFQKVFGTDFKTVVVNNVIDEEEILQKAEEPIKWDCKNHEKRLLAVGRLSSEKNFKYLIDSCAKLRDAGYSFQLIILGEGPERPKLECQIRASGLCDCIKLYGFCQNPYPYMKKADVIVCSSIYEGISTVVLEALILGKSVITTPCGGMKELLGDSEYGMIADDGDNGLYQCMEKFLSDPMLKRQNEVQAKIRAEKFSKSNVLSGTETMFCDVLQSMKK